jgi:SAM-dependent methyltransferase
MTDDWAEANRELWDERVPIHVASELYDVEAFVAGRSSLRAFELAELADVRGRTLVHPQCHFGEDTLSWARLGAEVTGLDFSGPAIAAARTLAARCGLAAEFVEANVLDAAEALGGRRFEIVYTGLGAINWLPDIDRWAHVMASLAAPGGCLYLAEFHPFSHVFADDDLTVEYPYFHAEPFDFPTSGTYADPEARTVHNRSYEWNHGVGAVVSALIGAGFELEFLHEHDHTLYARWPFLVGERGAFRMPEARPSLPLLYSLRARRRA